MYCKNCGKKIQKKEKKCLYCGEPNIQIVIKDANYPKPPKKKWNFLRIIVTFGIVLIILFRIGIIGYNYIEKESINTNNEAISSFNAGNSEVAIKKLQQALKDAKFNINKLNALKNLGYIYLSEGQNDKAITSFKNALRYTNDKFEYYLISGEIATLKNEIDVAEKNLLKAYKLHPNDFQINNTLNLFYLDLKDIAPKYADYKKALHYAKQAFNASPLDTKNIAQQNLALAYFFNKNYTETIKILSKFDTDKEPYLAYWLGLSYINIGNDKMGVFYLKKAIDSGIEVSQEIHDYISEYTSGYTPEYVPEKK